MERHCGRNGRTPFVIPLHQHEEAQAWLLRTTSTLRLSEDASTIESLSASSLESTVKGIIAEVRRDGDQAMRCLAARFGDTLPESLLVSPETLAFLRQSLPEETRRILDRAANHITAFAQAIRDQLSPVRIDHDGFSVG